MKGCVAVFINPRGQVICSVNDFEESGFGGFTLEQAQKIRCKNRIAREVVSSYSSPDFADNVKSYTAERIVDDLLEAGFKIHYEYIGHAP